MSTIDDEPGNGNAVVKEITHMEKINLIKILDGDIPLISAVDERDIGLYENEVIIYPHHIKNIIMRYLSGELTAQDLTCWAGFICIRGEYIVPKSPSTDEDYYENMYYIIQRLSTPEIDGEVNKSSVNTYLSELQKYL